jgi:hypothetical protein
VIYIGHVLLDMHVLLLNGKFLSPDQEQDELSYQQGEGRETLV